MDAGSKPQPIIGALMIFTSLLGVAGNTITLTLIIKNRTFRNVNQARLFLANLAVADLLNSILAMFSGLGHVDKRTIMSDHRLCYFTGYACVLLPYLALFSMTLLTMNRYYTMVDYQKARKLFGQNLSHRYIIPVWIFPLLIFLIFGITNSDVNQNSKYLWGLCVVDNARIRTVTMVMSTLGVICLIFMCFVNFRIWLHLRRYNRRIRDESIISNLESSSRDKKITKIVSVIFLSFMILYIPITVEFIVTRVIRNEEQPSLSLVSYVLLNMNYVNNFFIYGVMDKVYRRNLKKLFCKERIKQVSQVRPMRNFYP